MISNVIEIVINQRIDEVLDLWRLRLDLDGASELRRGDLEKKVGGEGFQAPRQLVWVGSLQPLFFSCKSSALGAITFGAA